MPIRSPDPALHNLPNSAKWAITIGLITIAALSWSHHLDEAANTATLTHFKRALAVAALARGFNGVISVAQGTEVAVQPVGIGVTLTIGEILDPLNDLIERFSALALLASVSLGLQLTLGQMAASHWLSALLSAFVLIYVVMLWRKPNPLRSPMERQLPIAMGRLLGIAVFLRFLLVFVLLTTHLIDQAFLADKQDDAVAGLSAAASTIEQLQEQTTDAQSAVDEENFFDRTSTQIRDFLDASRQALDLKAQLAEIQQQVENSVEEIINLIVVFLIQTLLLPAAGLWLSARLLLVFWRYSDGSR